MRVTFGSIVRNRLIDSHPTTERSEISDGQSHTPPFTGVPRSSVYQGDSNVQTGEALARLPEDCARVDTQHPAALGALAAGRLSLMDYLK